VLGQVATERGVQGATRREGGDIVAIKVLKVSENSCPEDARRFCARGRHRRDPRPPEHRPHSRHGCRRAAVSTGRDGVRPRRDGPCPAPPPRPTRRAGSRSNRHAQIAVQRFVSIFVRADTEHRPPRRNPDTILISRRTASLSFVDFGLAKSVTYCRSRRVSPERGRSRRRRSPTCRPASLVVGDRGSADRTSTRSLATL